MSDHKYDLALLQDLEEIAKEKADKLGLEVPETLFHLVQAEEMYDIAARGLPGRYSHYSFGRKYQEEKSAYDKGRSRIYELVINTRPVHAYLLDGNSLIAQLLVMAHVFGHATVYQHNRYFDVADKNILSRTRAAAERIDRYIGEYGRDAVENFIDSCEFLQYQRSFDQLGAKHTAKAPVWETKPFDMLFPQETVERREKFKADKEDFRTRFPKQPERDFLEFFERHSRHLEDWQKDVISIIRMEQEYFTAMMRTQVIHEAQAVYYHQTIVHQMMAEDPRFDTDDFMEFQGMNARVLAPHVQQIMVMNEDTGEEEPRIACVSLNPYLTGSAIYSEVKRLCEGTNVTDEEREKWPWIGQISWDEKRAELVEAYDDAALLAEFISPNVCEKAKLYMEPRTPEGFKNLRVLEKEAEEVRKTLVEQKTFFGVPTVEIVDADYKRRGELYLEHRWDKLGLDDEYTRGILPHVAEMWGHAVTVHTCDYDPETDEHTDIWYRVEPGETIDEVERHTRQP